MQATTVTGPIRDTGDALRASLAGAFSTLLSAIPRIIGFALVLILGWMISSLLARAVVALLRAIRFDELAHRSGFADFVETMGVRQDSSDVIASIAKWFVRLITLVVAFDTLGVPAVSNVLQQLLLWLPNLVVGLVVLVVGGLLANALSNLVRGATAKAGFTNPDTLATVARVAVWSFAIVVAVNQLGIATTLINTLVVGVVGALALATGLAFGLGGRDRAAQLLEAMGRRTESAGPRPERSVAPIATPSGAAALSTGGMGASMRAPSSAASAPGVAPTDAPSDDWVERSGFDRRRVSRAGIERRAAANGTVA